MVLVSLQAQEGISPAAVMHFPTPVVYCEELTKLIIDSIFLYQLLRCHEVFCGQQCMSEEYTL